jgi:hypothetical protein
MSILVKTSATKLKRRGDRGSPCLNPFPGLKKVLFSSFILMQIDPSRTTFEIHHLHLSPKPPFF